MVKWHRLIISGILLATLGSVTGCTRSRSTAQPDSGPVTLTMYQVGTRPKHYQRLITRANKILVRRANAKLKITYIGWGNYSQKMAVINSSGAHYDLAKADNYSVNAQRGVYADLTKLLPKYAAKAYHQLDPAYVKGNTIDGKLYALPVNGNVYGTQVIAFNQRLVKKYGLDISHVHSYAALAPVLKAFHKKAPKTVAFAVGKGFKVESNFDYPLGNTLPFAVDVSAGGNHRKIVNQYDSPQMRANLQALHRYYLAGYVPRDATTSNTNFPINELNWFARQETVGPYDYGDLALNYAAGGTDRIVSKTITTPLKSVSQLQVFNWVVGRGSKHQALAVKVLGLLQTDRALLNGLVWGQSGVDYHKTGTNTISLTAQYSSQNQMAPWMTGNNANLYTTDQVTTKMLKHRDQTIKQAVSSPLLGFTPDTSAVKTEIAAIQTIMDQYIDGLNTGTSAPLRTIQQMDAALQRAGYAKVQRLLQQQYTAYLAKQA